MARQATTLVLFLFIMCLCSLCLAALGGGVFYACSDGTMNPSEFDFKKCGNFGIKDVEAVVTGDIKETSEVESTETSDDFSSGDGLIPDQPVDDEAADPNLNFLDYFNRDRKKFSGDGVVASATNAAECAKICFNDEIDMPNESEKCQGFVSDDSTYCKLYPTIDSMDGEIHSQHKAYRLKENKESGGRVVQYTTTRNSTGYGPDGGTKEYGNRHDLDCGVNGALTSFKFNKSGNQVNNSFTCAKSEALGGSTSKMTEVNASGKSGGRNDMYYIDRHDINCGDNFLSQWKLAQWSKSIRVHYSCTTSKTPRPDECEELTASGYSRNSHVGTWRGNEVKCPANKLLTQWKYSNDSVTYRCCPKPTHSLGRATGTTIR
jgi:hypothetical protein